MTSKLMSNLFGASRTRSSHLLRQRVHVSQKEFAETVHLIDHFQGRVVLVQHIIAVKSKLVRPTLQLLGYETFCCHFIDSFFDFPRLDLGRQCLQRQFHRFAVHSGSRVKVSPFTRFSSLFECFRDIDGDIHGDINGNKSGKYFAQHPRRASARKIAGIVRGIQAPRSIGRSYSRCDRHMTGGAICKDRPPRRVVRICDQSGHHERTNFSSLCNAGNRWQKRPWGTFYQI
jgi:hypothetical protein